MQREADLQREILRVWGAHPRVRLWRANAGRALVATASGGLRSLQMNVTGCPDLIGWTCVSVQRLVELELTDVAIFTGIEVKSETGTIREAQSAFAFVLERMGGLPILARRMTDVGFAMKVLLP